MSEQKYYTPAPEDIREGFEFESNETGKWQSIKIESHIRNNASNIIALLGNYPYKFRVPYLTAEQIKAEGWEKSGEHSFQKANYSFSRFGPLNSCDMACHITFCGGDIYVGRCRCLNDFRLICKLLGI